MKTPTVVLYLLVREAVCSRVNHQSRTDNTSTHVVAQHSAGCDTDIIVSSMGGQKYRLQAELYFDGSKSLWPHILTRTSKGNSECPSGTESHYAIGCVAGKPVLRKDQMCEAELITREVRGFDGVHWWRSTALHGGDKRIDFAGRTGLLQISHGSVSFTPASSSCGATREEAHTRFRYLASKLDGLCADANKHSSAGDERCKEVHGLSFLSMMSEVEGYARQRRQLEAMDCFRSSANPLQEHGVGDILRAIFVRAHAESGQRQARERFDTALFKLQSLRCGRDACEPTKTELVDLISSLDFGPGLAENVASPVGTDAERSFRERLVQGEESSDEDSLYPMLKQDVDRCVSKQECEGMAPWVHGGYTASSALVDLGAPDSMNDFLAQLEEATKPKPLWYRVGASIVVFFVDILLLVFFVAISPFLLLIMLISYIGKALFGS